MSAYIPAVICPVHILWPWVCKNASPGGRLFFDNIAARAASWLGIALEARCIPHAEKFTLHSLRRGAAQALVKGGGDLPTLLKAGGWRSSAFKAYMDLMGIENAVFTASVNKLIELDDDGHTD